MIWKGIKPDTYREAVADLKEEYQQKHLPPTINAHNLNTIASTLNFGNNSVLKESFTDEVSAAV